MNLSKETIVDRIETLRIEDHYIIQVRMKDRILENGNEISTALRRTSYAPDHNVDEIEDTVIKAQFNAIMTDAIKQNYQEFISQQ